MRWLQWSRYDLAQGLGGVEVHARSLSRELSRMGIENALSSDPAELKNPAWDVIHTHGSEPLPYSYLVKKNHRPIFVHTLHGTTLGRMTACGEWTWVGGYLAASRETIAVTRSDVVLAVHSDLHLYRLADSLGKVHAVCSNGWDSGLEVEALPETLEIPEKAWAYIGRAADPVKGASRLKDALKLMPDIRLVVVPGGGFEMGYQVVGTGPLTSPQVSALLWKVQGLILPSRYEGLPLVVLEALAHGTPVVTTQVGGICQLPHGLEGLVVTDSGDPRSIADAVRSASRFSSDGAAGRAAANQKVLLTWRQVAEKAVDAVHSALFLRQGGSKAARTES